MNPDHAATKPDDAAAEPVAVALLVWESPGSNSHSVMQCMHATVATDRLTDTETESLQEAVSESERE